MATSQALSHREQLATLADLWGWTREPRQAGTSVPAAVDQYRRGDVVISVSFTSTGRIRFGDRAMDGGSSQVVPTRGKLDHIGAWLRRSDDARDQIVEAAAANGWVDVTDGTVHDLAFERGTLDTSEYAPSAAEQDGTEAMIIDLGADGSVARAAAKGWDRSPRGTGGKRLAAVLARLAWAPPSVRCTRCGKPEHRHHLGGHDMVVPELASEVHAADALRTQLAGRELRPQPTADDAHDMLVLDVAAGPVDIGGARGERLGLADFVELGADDDPEALADLAAGALATLVGIARPDHRAAAEREGRQLTTALRALRELAVERTQERDRARELAKRQGRQVAELAGKVRDLAGQLTATASGAERPAGASLASTGGVTLDVVPELLSGDVSARDLLGPLATTGHVTLSPSGGVATLPGWKVVRLVEGQRLAGFVDPAGKFTASRVSGNDVEVHPAGLALYLARLARHRDNPTTGTRVKIAREVDQRVARARRRARAGT
jgi:hypothetical protein